MDTYIEYGFWERAKEFLTDYNNVRVICFYKYGKEKDEMGNPFTGKYAEPGDIVWFELTSDTDLNKIKEEGFQAHGLGVLAKLLQIAILTRCVCSWSAAAWYVRQRPIRSPSGATVPALML
jgi:hypothetical protein